MKSLWKSILFIVVLFVGILNTQVTAKCQHHTFCDYDMKVPAYVAKHCSGIDSGKTVNLHISALVDRAMESVAGYCREHVKSLCDVLPSLVKYVIEFLDVCKEDMEKHICSFENGAHQSFLREKVYHLYLSTVQEVLQRERNFIPGKEQQICALFEQNDHLLTLIKEQKCDLISSVLTQSSCRRGIKKIAKSK